jgi:hypothetical protein
LLPSTGAARCSNAFRSHPLPVGTPASHRRGPPGRCPLPLATPDARYGPRTASASAVLPSLPWATRRRPNLLRPPSIPPRREIDAAARSEPGFPSHSPTLRPWIACTASYVEELWSPSLGRCPEKWQAKAHAYSPAQFSARSAEGLSLSGGASIRSRACSS